MSIKDDIKDAKETLEDVKTRNSLAWEMLSDLRKEKDNLLTANVVLALSLLVAIMIIIFK